MTGTAQPQPTWVAADQHRRLTMRRDRLRLALWGTGVVVLLTGTFLPWLQSGRVPKNSYQLAGVGRRALNSPAWVDFLLGGWPFLGPLWAVVAVLMIVKFRRAAACLSIGLGLIAGLVAGAALAVSSRLGSAYLSAAWTGPIVTAVGAVLVVGAAYRLLAAGVFLRTS